MSRTLAIELTMMVMIENEFGEVLVQDRQKKDWPGWTFPGGHVEKDEGSYSAAVREVKEETGLTIQPVLRGTVEWNNLTKETRELAFLYTAQVKKQAVADDLFWVKKSELNQQKLAGTLNELLPIFLVTSSKSILRYKEKAYPTKRIRLFFILELFLMPMSLFPA